MALANQWSLDVARPLWSGAGLDVQDAMAFAAAAAALKCTRSGGRAGIPSINDCLAFMRTHQ